jgi:hypothetical protein
VGNHFSDPGADMLAFSYSGAANGTIVPGIYIYYNFTDLVQMSDPAYSLSFTINGGPELVPPLSAKSRMVDPDTIRA